MPTPGSVSDAAEIVFASRRVMVTELGSESTESVVPRLSNCCMQWKAIAKRLLLLHGRGGALAVESRAGNRREGSDRRAAGFSVDRPHQRRPAGDAAALRPLSCSLSQSLS